MVRRPFQNPPVRFSRRPPARHVRGRQLQYFLYPYFPTLSFQDFCALSGRPLTWKAIQARALDSYAKLAATENHPFYKKHHTMIIKHANQPGKSVLLFSGRWSSFTTACADTLAQDVLKSSPLSVFALRTCHPLSNPVT